MSAAPTSAPVTVRLARVEDLPALARLQTEAARALSRGYTAEQVQAYLREHGVTDERLVRDGTYYVAEVAGRIVGCGGWSFRPDLVGVGEGQGVEARLDPAREPARLRAFFVDPGWARRGIARRLLRRSESAAFAAGYGHGRLQATPSGRPLYESEGYALVRREDVEAAGVAPLESFIMEKALGPAPPA